MTERSKVREFHQNMQQPRPDAPEIPTLAVRTARVNMTLQEALEVADAWGFRVLCNGQPLANQYALTIEPVREPDLAKIAHENADLRYVSHGNDVVAGIPSEVFDEVHRANMEKEPPTEPHGKAKKPIGWRPPDVKGVIERFLLVCCACSNTGTVPAYKDIPARPCACKSSAPALVGERCSPCEPSDSCRVVCTALAGASQGTVARETGFTLSDPRASCTHAHPICDPCLDGIARDNAPDVRPDLAGEGNTSDLASGD